MRAGTQVTSYYGSGSCDLKQGDGMRAGQSTKEETLTLYVVDTSHLNRRDLTHFLNDLLRYRTQLEYPIFRTIVPNVQNAVFLHINTSTGHEKMASLPDARKVKSDMSSPAWGMFGAYGTNHTSNLHHVSIYNLNTEFLADFASLYFADSHMEALAFLANHEAMQSATDEHLLTKQLSEYDCPINNYIQLVLFTQFMFLTTGQGERGAVRYLTNYAYKFNHFLEWRKKQSDTVKYLRQNKLDKVKKRPREVIDIVKLIEQAHNKNIVSALKVEEARRHIARLTAILKSDKFVKVEQALKEAYLSIVTPEIEEIITEFNRVKTKYPNFFYSLSVPLNEKDCVRVEE